MKRFYFTALIITLIANSVYSQTSPKVHLGQMVKQTMKESWADIEPLTYDDQGAYYLSLPYSAVMSGPMIADDDYYLFLVNDAGELAKKGKADFTVDDRPSSFEFARELNGKVIVFTSVENKKQRSVAFYASELDKKNLQLINRKKVVELSFAQVKRQYERASFKCELSRDKSKMLISYSLVDDENSLLSFGYVVLSSAMKELYKWGGNLDMSDGVYLFDQFRISNNGEVYLQTRYFSNEKAHDKNVSMKKTNLLSTTRSMEYRKNYEHRVVKFEKTGTNIISIPNRERFYDVLDMQVAPDGNLIMIGFYSPLEDEVMPVGAASLIVNAKTGKVKATVKEFGNIYEMPSDITNKNNGLAAGKDQYLKYRFIVSDIHFNKNGGYTLIGERNVRQTKRNGNVFYTVNHLDDLAVVEVNASGAVTGVHKVEKSQQAVDVEIFNASYFYTEHNNQKYIAFANFGKGSLKESILVNIAPGGKQTREVLFNSKDSEVTLRPQDCQLHKGKVVMYGNRNNRYVRWMNLAL